MSTETPDYMKTYADRWQSIVENPDGTLNLDQVARELFDYATLMGNATEVYLAVTGERFGKANTAPSAVIDAVNERIDEAGASVNRWWITTGPLPAGGEKVLGPFESQDLAIQVRTLMEAAQRRDGAYWVDDEDESGEG